MTQTNSQIREEWQKTFLDAGSMLLEEDLSVMIPIVSDIIDSLLKTQREEMIEKIEKLYRNSESRVSELQCSQDGYEYGLEDIINLIKEQ